MTISETTHKRMQENPEELIDYLRKLGQERKKWTLDPLEVIISRIKKMSDTWQIGDFGCGEAKIMETFGADRVHSFDHVALKDKVTACDMKQTALKDGSLSIIVFCLSLMSKNWANYIVEARRCLGMQGSLIIAETTKSLISGRLVSLREVIKANGFVIDVDEQRGQFTLIETTKV
jgi:hypothetical protein